MDPPACTYLKCTVGSFLGERRDMGKSRGASAPTLSERQEGHNQQGSKQDTVSKKLVIPADSNPPALLEDRRRTGAGKGGPVVRNLHSRITVKVSGAAITPAIAPC